VFYGLLAIPLFFFTRDAPRPDRADKAGRAPNASLELWDALKGLPKRRDLGLYLASQMLFTDGLTAILFFTGVYAGGVMHWGVIELLAYALTLSLTAVFGGFLSGWMDRWLGTKRALQAQLVAAIGVQILMLGMSPTRILYVIPWDPSTHPAVWAGPVFKTLPELIFLGIGMLGAIAVTGAYASSRVMIVHLAPAKRIGVYFGLFALSSTVTTWLGSLLVGLATAVFHTQQAGMVPIMLLLGIGLAILSVVRVPAQPPAD
jgi:UMF1 family MFS transporter